MKLLKNIWSGLTTLALILIVLLAVALAGVRLIGYTPYAVLSGSMTPQYKVGDLIYVKKTPPEEIKPGAVITFVADERLTIVTHRVTAVNAEEGSFTTKGDANSSQDGAPVLFENVLGVVQFSIPALGYLSGYLSTASGRYAAAAAVLALVLFMLLPELFRKDPEPAEKDAPPINLG